MTEDLGRKTKRTRASRPLPRPEPPAGTPGDRPLAGRLRAWADDHRSRWFLLWSGVGIVALYAVWSPAWRALWDFALDPAWCNDDARTQIYPFLRYGEAGLFPRDVPGDYILATLGWGYRLLYMLGAKLGDVRTMSKVLPFVLFALTAGGLAWAASRWARMAGAFVAVALCLSTDVFIERMAGGLPRGFGFAIAAWAVAALVHGRMMLLAVVTCLGAAFYSAAAVPPGMALALVVLLFPAEHRGDAAQWSPKKRLAVVAGTGLVSAMLLLPTMLAMRPYGSAVRPADVAEFPEADSGGRFYHGDAPPYKAFLTTLTEEAPKPLVGGGNRLTKLTDDDAATKDEVNRSRAGFTHLLVGLAVGAYLVLLRRTSGAKRVGALLFAATVGFFVSYRLVPYMYLPQRYIAYPAPILVTLFTATGGVGLFGALTGTHARHGVRHALATLAFGALALLTVGGQGNPKAGINTTRGGSRLYAFLESLPKDVLVAGWPAGTMDNIPYFSKRQVLVMFETHVPFSKGHTLELRRRTEAVVRAYFASDLEPIRALARDFGVTHLLVDTRHFKGAPPRYFKPFDRTIAEAHAQGAKAGFLLPELAAKGGVFKEGSLVVLDLSRIGE